MLINGSPKSMTIRVVIAVLVVSANVIFAQGTVHWTWTTQTGTPFQCSFDTSWDEAMTPGTSWNNDPLIRNSFTITDAFGATLAYDGNWIEIEISGRAGNPLNPTFEIMLRDWASRYYQPSGYTAINIFGGGSSWQSTIFQQGMDDPYPTYGSAQGYWSTVIVPEPSSPALLALSSLVLLVGRRIVGKQWAPFQRRTSVLEATAG
jgi:hypothetical protein